jgi:hypothetical protein
MGPRTLPRARPRRYGGASCTFAQLILPWDGGSTTTGFATDKQAIASCFFVSVGGLFLTARHNVEEFLGPDGFKRHPQIAVFALAPDERAFVYLPVEWIRAHPTADVAMGFAPLIGQEDVARKIRFHALATAPLTYGDPFAMAGFGDTKTEEEYSEATTGLALRIHLRPNVHFGEILDVMPRSRAGGPSYALNIHTPMGLSGGPVMRASDFAVCSLVSSGADGADYGIALQIGTVLDWRVRELGADERRTHPGTSLRELAFMAPAARIQVIH